LIAAGRDAGVKRFVAQSFCGWPYARVGGPVKSLDRDSGYPWDADISTLPVVGSYMTEVEFFGRASRTLVVTDLIDNQMPRDVRLTFAKQKPQLRAAIETMRGWNPERIILAHGRWYERNGANELRRAFRWILKER
jgi:hypothetical protein